MQSTSQEPVDFRNSSLLEYNLILIKLYSESASPGLHQKINENDFIRKNDTFKSLRYKFLILELEKTDLRIMRSLEEKKFKSEHIISIKPTIVIGTLYTSGEL